jgi:hypothetical protein
MRATGICISAIFYRPVVATAPMSQLGLVRFSEVQIRQRHLAYYTLVLVTTIVLKASPKILLGFRVLEPGPRLEWGSELCARLVSLLAWNVLRMNCQHCCGNLALRSCAVIIDKDLVIDREL